MAALITPCTSATDAPFMSLANGNFEVLAKLLRLPPGELTCAQIRAALNRITPADIDQALRHQSTTQLDRADILSYTKDICRVCDYSETHDCTVLFGA